MAKPKSVTIKLTPAQRSKIAKSIGQSPDEVMFQAAGGPPRVAGKAATKTAPGTIPLKRRFTQLEIALPRAVMVKAVSRKLVRPD